MRNFFLVLGFMLATTALHAQCDMNATPANFASQLSALPAGQSLCLGSGSYGAFPSSVVKSSLTHVRPATGASVSFSSTDIAPTTRNIYLHGPISWTGYLEINAGAGGLNFWVEGTWANVAHKPNGHEGRISVYCNSGCGSSGVHLMNIKAGPGGCSDGIQLLTGGVEIGFYEASGVLQGNCSEHVDPIQLYGGDTANMHDMYLHGNDSGLMAPDGSTGTIVTNSYIKTNGNQYAMVLGNCRNCTITHNVADADVYDGNPTNQPGCTQRKSTNVVYQNNVGTMSGCGTNVVNDHNLTSVTFVGGPGLCGFATASPLGTGTNGSTIGISCGTPPPPTAPSITTTSLQNGTVGTPYAAQLSYTGGTGTPSWTSTGLPAGLALSVAGAISGTPITAMSYSPSFTVTAGQASTPKVLPITVAAVPPPPSFPAVGKRGKVLDPTGANIRQTAVCGGLGPKLGTAPVDSSFTILIVTVNCAPQGVPGAVWVQVDYDDPSLPTGYMGSDNMVEITTAPPPPSLLLNCTQAKTGFTGSNIPAGTVLTITGSIPGASPVSCTTSLP